MSGEVGGKRIGVREVAAAAGVSTQTVSRVLNGYPGIREATRERVLDAVATLDYRVNNAARALGTSLTRTVGVVASDAVLHGPAAGIAALEGPRGRGVGGSRPRTPTPDDPADIDAAVRHLLDQGVDGIVLVAAHGATALDGFDVPIVPLYGESGARQRDAAALVVEHLADLGHRRIIEVAGPSDWRESLARTAGVADAVARLDLELVDRAEGDWSAASGFALSEAAVAAACATGSRPSPSPTTRWLSVSSGGSPPGGSRCRPMSRSRDSMTIGCRVLHPRAHDRAPRRRGRGRARGRGRDGRVVGAPGRTGAGGSRVDGLAR